jgi:hypothetical protein
MPLLSVSPLYKSVTKGKVKITTTDSFAYKNNNIASA